jgi:hypothetical protein
MTIDVVLSISGIPTTSPSAPILSALGRTMALTRTSLGTEVPEDDDRLLSNLDRLLLDGLGDLVLVVKDASLARELESLLSGDLGNTSSRCKVTTEDTRGSVSARVEIYGEGRTGCDP